jgi:hypothetical protein
MSRSGVNLSSSSASTHNADQSEEDQIPTNDHGDCLGDSADSEVQVNVSNSPTQSPVHAPDQSSSSPIESQSNIHSAQSILSSSSAEDEHSSSQQNDHQNAKHQKCF